MRKTALRVFLFAVVSYLLVYLGAVVYHLIGYPQDQLLYMYRIPWLAEEALRTTVGILPTVHVSAVLLAFAIGVRQPGGAALEDPAAALRKSLTVFLLLTVVFAALDVGVHPLLHRHRHDRLYLSRLGKDYLRRAEQAQEAEDLATALELYRNYLSIDPDNDFVEDRADKIAGQISAAQEQETEAGEEFTPAHRRYRDLTPVELVELANQRLDNNDPFSAHYLARLAVELAPERQDAKRLASRAWNRIREMEPSPREREEHEIYSRKVAGYNALDRGRPVEAYYIFEKLHEEVPGDPDVQEYYHLSREQAQQVSYFIEEARETDTVPGVRKVLYLSPGTGPAPDGGGSTPSGSSGGSENESGGNETDRSSGGSGSNAGGSEVGGSEAAENDTDKSSGGRGNDSGGLPRRVLFFDKLVQARSGTWVHEAEIIEFDPDGSIRFHLTAPYGKINGDSLILRGIHRSKQEAALAPEYIAGSPPEEPAQIVSLAPTPRQLRLLSQRRDFFERLSLLDLIRLEPVLSRFGYSPRDVRVAVLQRLNEPFLFFIVSFFAAAIGLRLRARRRRFPVLLLAAVPLVPVIIYALLEAYRYAFLLGFSLFVTLAGMTATLLIFLGIQALLLFIGMLFVATYREP